MLGGRVVGQTAKGAVGVQRGRVGLSELPVQLRGRNEAAIAPVLLRARRGKDT